MQMQNGTKLFVVSSDGLSEMTFGNLNDALKGGTRMEEVEVFTDHEEARLVDRARKRRGCVSQFSTEDVNRAAKMVLIDEEGEVIHELLFYSTA